MLRSQKEENILDIFRVYELIRMRYSTVNLADITRIPHDQPKEIIFETRRNEFSNQGTAIAVIDRSEPHYHKHTIEVYRVLRGHLRVYLDDDSVYLRQGQIVIIPPGVVHWAEGNQTWVEVTTAPAWSADDHILIENGQSKL